MVFGIAGGLTGYCGASVNHMVVNQDLVYNKPDKLNIDEAAAFPLVFITAYEAHAYYESGKHTGKIIIENINKI